MAYTYTPKFHMPIIAAPPPASPPVDPAAYYSTVTAATSPKITQVPNKGLQIELSNAAYNQLFAMAGGLIAFIPAGKSLPTKGKELSPGEGSLVLNLQLVDVSNLRNILKMSAPGVPTFLTVLYLNVKPDSARIALEPAVKILADGRLEEVWNKGHTISATSRTELEDYYLDQFILGQLGVFVEGGSPIGNAASSSTSTVALTLRLTDPKGDDLSPLLHLRGMPIYGDKQWTGHPLTVGIAGLTIPVEIYVRFEVWNEVSKAFEKLPSGVEVSLMDYDPGSPDDPLDSQNTDLNGQVHFTILDVQAVTDPDKSNPDLYFLVHTNGMSFAGHTLPSEWSTKGWKAADGVSLGYYDDFAGTTIGDSVDPLVFRIGLDFHIRLTYEDRSKPLSIGAVGVQNGASTVVGSGSGIQWDARLVGMMFRISGEQTSYTISGVGPPNNLTLSSNYLGVTGSGKPYIIEAIAPKDIPVSLCEGVLPRYPSNPPGFKKTSSLTTNEKGEVHGVIFDIEGADSLYFHIDFQMQDPNIHLPKVKVIFVQRPGDLETDGWDSSWADTDQKIFADNERTSIGMQSEPEVLHCKASNHNLALYLLKIVRELSTFLVHITDGAWTGVTGLILYTRALPGVAYSWPKGAVNLPHNVYKCGPSSSLLPSYWCRSTVIHELSHQLMWQESKFKDLNIGGLFIEGFFGREYGYQSSHHPKYLTNKFTALVEGWAQCIASIFTEKVAAGGWPYSFTNPTTGKQGRLIGNTGSWADLGPPPNNRGEESEGSFINALWSIFQKYIVMMAANQNIPESINGDVTLTAPWIKNTPDLKTRFLSIIWGPLQDLSLIPNDSDKDSTAFINSIRLHPGNLKDWHKLQAEFQAFNMSMDVPTVTLIKPSSGSIGALQRLIINGTNFVLGAVVKVGALTAINVNVKSSTELEADIPAGGTVGVVDVVVTTLAGPGRLPNGYTFVK